MPRRNIIASVVVILIAALFVRLGVWQLHRLHERRARNAEVAARTAMAPVPLDQLPTDTAQALYRRVTLTGVYDYPRQFVLTARSFGGSPGVYLMTPMRLLHSKRAVLVNRGWVYSPDASTVTFERWREPDTVTITAFVEEFDPARGLPEGNDPQHWRELDPVRVAATLPYRVEPYYIVVLPDGKPPVSTEIARLSPPPLDEGPHKSYAIQWFSFAAIALFGLVFLFRPDLVSRTGWGGGVTSGETSRQGSERRASGVGHQASERRSSGVSRPSSAASRGHHGRLTTDD